MNLFYFIDILTISLPCLCINFLFFIVSCRRILYVMIISLFCLPPLAIHWSILQTQLKGKFYHLNGPIHLFCVPFYEATLERKSKLFRKSMLDGNEKNFCFESEAWTFHFCTPITCQCILFY